MPPRTAFGTFTSGLSTASALAQADSIPRKAHSVIVMELVAASPKGILFTFQFAMYMSGEKKNQPMIARPIQGIITPHTVIEETLPVYFGPPKLSTVANQSTPMVATAVMTGSKVLPKNPQPYPTAEIAIAVLAKIKDTPYV